MRLIPRLGPRGRKSKLRSLDQRWGDPSCAVAVLAEQLLPHLANNLLLYLCGFDARLPTIQVGLEKALRGPALKSVISFSSMAPFRRAFCTSAGSYISH